MGKNFNNQFSKENILKVKQHEKLLNLIDQSAMQLKPLQVTNAGEELQQLVFSYIACKELNLAKLLWKTVWQYQRS